MLALVSLFALDLDKLKPQGYISDFARVLDAGSRAQLESYAGRVEQATGVQMAIVTIDSLDGEPIEDVSNSLYRKWGVGKKGKDEGILLLLAIKDHRDRLEIGYGLEPILPDGFDGSVLRAARPLLRQGAYGQALFAAAEEMGTRIAAAKGVTLDFGVGRSLRRRVRPGAERPSIPWPLVVIGIIFLLFLMRRGGGGGGFLAGMILGNLLGRGGGGGWGGGGGFGGYDSGGGGGGGGFGGFGGGDSGGGGASSDW